jgi:HSP90 family molecular chaperone
LWWLFVSREHTRKPTPPTRTHIHTHSLSSLSLTRQNSIYYLCAPNRELAEASPYFEAFKRHNKEVIFVYNAIDDFVMNNLRTYHGRCVLVVWEGGWMVVRGWWCLGGVVGVWGMVVVGGWWGSGRY